MSDTPTNLIDTPQTTELATLLNAEIAAATAFHDATDAVRGHLSALVTRGSNDSEAIQIVADAITSGVLPFERYVAATPSDDFHREVSRLVAPGLAAAMADASTMARLAPEIFNGLSHEGRLATAQSLVAAAATNPLPYRIALVHALEPQVAKFEMGRWSGLDVESQLEVAALWDPRASASEACESYCRRIATISFASVPEVAIRAFRDTKQKFQTAFSTHHDDSTFKTPMTEAFLRAARNGDATPLERLRLTDKLLTTDIYVMHYDEGKKLGRAVVDTIEPALGALLKSGVSPTEFVEICERLDSAIPQIFGPRDLPQARARFIGDALRTFRDYLETVESPVDSRFKFVVAAAEGTTGSRLGFRQAAFESEGRLLVRDDSADDLSRLLGLAQSLPNDERKRLFTMLIVLRPKVGAALYETLNQDDQLRIPVDALRALKPELSPAMRTRFAVDAAITFATGRLYEVLEPVQKGDRECVPYQLDPLDLDMFVAMMNEAQLPRALQRIDKLNESGRELSARDQIWLALTAAVEQQKGVSPERLCDLLSLVGSHASLRPYRSEAFFPDFLIACESFFGTGYLRMSGGHSQVQLARAGYYKDFKTPQWV